VKAFLRSKSNQIKKKKAQRKNEKKTRTIFAFLSGKIDGFSDKYRKKTFFPRLETFFRPNSVPNPTELRSAAFGANPKSFQGSSVPWIVP
jgi:hypothetical protein